jgi:hypothetical protein
LSDNGVDHVIVGSFAYRAQGADCDYDDIDTIYKSTPDNLNRIKATLIQVSGDPWVCDQIDFEEDTCITLVLNEGKKIDMLMKLRSNYYEDVIKDSVVANYFGANLRVCSPVKLLELLKAKCRALGLVFVKENTAQHVPLPTDVKLIDKINKTESQLAFLSKLIPEAGLIPPFVRSF